MGTIGGNQFQFNEIQNAYELFKSYDKNKAAIKGGKVTDLFFVHTGHGLEFVKKYSVSGQWMRFVSWVKQKFGNEDKTFDVEKNLSDVGKLYEKIFSTLSVEDKNKLDSIAKKLGILPKEHLSAGEVLRENLLELGIHLNQLKYRVERSRFEQKQEIFLSGKKVGKSPEFQPLKGIHIPLYAKRVQSSFATFQANNQAENSQVFDAIGKRFSRQLSQDEVQAVASCIISSGKKGEILKELESHKTASLLASLRKTFSFAIARENRSLIRSALDKIAPLEASVEQSKLDLHNFSAFFGRPDINRRSSLSIEDNHKLIVSFLNSSTVKPELCQLVEEAIIISTETNVEELKAKVESRQKCLILGGTAHHPILFSLAKQPDGKYSVKIYSQQPQKALPPELKTPAQNGQGYLEIKGVLRDTLFKEGFVNPSVLKAVVELHSKSESDASLYFEDYVIDQLGISKSENEFIQHLLSPELSGTPASRAIIAALSNEMEQSSAIKLQNDFDKHLLDTFVKDLTALVKNSIAKENYHEIRALYTSIKHTLDGYKAQDGTDILAIYADLLDRLNEKLLGLQKELYTQELTARSPIQGELSVPMPKGKKPPEEAKNVTAAVIHPAMLDQTEMATLAKVQNLPFEEGLEALVKLSPSAEMYHYIADALFKKAGGLAELANLGMKDPVKTMQDLAILIDTLAANVDASNAATSQSERFGLYLAASYIREALFRRLNDEERIIKNDFPSVLASATLYEKMQKCRTSDPYWANFFKEASQLREALTAEQKEIAEHLFDISLHKEETVHLSPYLIEEFGRWLRDSSFVMPKKINGSIENDRKVQTQRIADEIASEKVKLAGYIKAKDGHIAKKASLESEKANLLATGKKLEEESKQLEAKFKELSAKKQTRSVTKAEQELQKAQVANEEGKKKVAENENSVKKIDEQIASISKEIKKIEGDIETCKKRIDGRIEKEVREDPQYWPWGISDKDSDTARWKPEDVAKFFFAEHAGFYKKKLHVDAILPDQFRLFRANSIITRNIFNKVSGKAPNDIPFTWENHTLRLAVANASFRQSVERPDIYLESLKTKKDLYKHLYNGRYIDELSIPNAVHVGLSKALSEKNQAPSMLSRLAGRLFSSGEVELDDEMRELCLLHCARELQVDSLISYFQENPKKLFEQDGRVLFHALAFESDLLLQAFKNEKTRNLVADRFKKLFHDVISSAAQLGDAETCANVCWLAATVQSYINNLGLAEKLPTTLSADDIMILAKNFYKQSHKSDWGIVAESILAATKHIQRAKIESKEQQTLFVLGLLSRAVRNMSDVPKEKLCALRAQDSQSAELMLKERLASTSQAEMQKMLEGTAPSILGTMFPALANASFKASAKKDEPHVFMTQDQKTILSLTDGLLTSSDPAVFRNYENPLPLEAKNLLLQQKVYPNQEAVADLRCYREGNVVSIYDKKRDMYLKASLKDHEIFIQKKGMPWCHHLHDSSKLLLTDQYTLQSFQQWFDAEKNKTYFVDPDTFKAKFETDEAGRIMNSETGRLLGVAQPHSFLAAFEDSGHTLYWVDKDKKLLSIDFPRLGLSLESKADGTFTLKGAPDWIVSKEQFLPHVDQKDGFLVLENAKTKEKKVLLPVWDLKVDGVYDFNSEALVGRTLEYTLNNDKLIPKSLEGRLYLAKLSLARGDIDQAEVLLFTKETEVTSRKLSSKRDFDKRAQEEKLQGLEYHKAYQSNLHEEVELYQSLAGLSLGDNPSPRAIRLQMHVLYLLKKNEEQFPKEALKEDPLEEIVPPSVREIEDEIGLVFDYLDTVIDEQPIDPHAELLVLKNIMRKIENQRYIETQNPQADKLHIEGLDELQTRIRELEHAVEEKPGHEFQEPILAEIKEKVEVVKDVPVEIRKNYETFRIESRLPFNPLNVDENEFKKYLPLLQEEASKLTSREAVQKSGLLAPISILAEFGKSSSIKQSAAALMSEFVQKGNMPVNEVYQNLQPLSLFKTMIEDRGVTRKLSQEYFVKGSKKESSPIASDLLSPYSPEIAEGDTITSKKFRSQSKDIQVATSLLAPGNYTLKNGKELDALRDTLQDQKSQELKLLAEQETLIINTVAQALHSDPSLVKEFALKLRSYPTIEEITLLIARRDFDSIASKFYPQISSEGKVNLKEAVKKYLFQKETVQQLARSLSALDDLSSAIKENKSDLIESLQNNLATQLELQRAYPPDHKHVMVFLFIETVLNIKLRPDQVQNILKFDKAILDGKSLVMQMIMGSGKTEVIQPFLAILLAKPDVLSTVIVPEALFAEVRKILTQTLGSAADQLLYTMPYDKELSQSPQFLDTVLQRLREAKERGGTLLLTPRQKHSILTSLYEAYFEFAVLSPGKDEQKLAHRLDKVSELAEFLQLHEIDQIDEIDFVMNPKVVFKRPLGDALIYDEKGRFERPKLLAELTLRLATNKKLRQEVSIDFVNAMQTSPGKEVEKPGLEINEQLYLTKVQPYLVSQALDILQKKNEQLTKIITENTATVEHFICQTATDKEKEWIKKNVTDNHAQDLLSSATVAISKIFPTSLLNECKSNYGKDPLLDKANPTDRRYIARPYFAPDAPKPTVYADPQEKIIYSMQYYIYNGIPLQDAKEMLIEWQQLARKEMKAGRKLEDSSWYARFNELLASQNQPMGLDFMEDPKSENFKSVVDSFQKAISKDPQTILEFCEKRLFPQNTLYTNNATSTPQTLVGASNAVFGYTGTIHKAILAAFMKAIPQIGTDGKTIAAIERKILNGTAGVDTLPKGAKLADEVITQFKDPDYYFFIDSGNWLKDEKIEVFVNRLLSECGRNDIEGVVYLDKNGNKISYEKNEKGDFSHVPFESSRLKNSPEKRLAVIGRKYETGTNISPQLSTAKGFLSLRKSMTLRDALQAAFRMRKILEGQAITIKIADEVKSHISQGILEGIFSHKEFFDFIDKNQPIDLVAFSEKLDNIKVRSELKDELLQDIETFSEMSDYFETHPEKKEKLTEQISRFTANNQPVDIRAFRQMLDTMNVPLDLKEELIQAVSKSGPISDYSRIHPELKEQLVNAAKRYNEKGEFTLLSIQEAFSQSFVPDSKAVWRYFTANLAKIEKEKNWLAARYRIRETLERPLRACLTDKSIDRKQRVELFKQIKSLMIQVETESNFDQLVQGSEEVDAKIAVDRYVDRYLTKFYDKLKDLPIFEKVNANISNNDPRTVLKNQLNACVKLDEIPAKIRLSEQDELGEMELEQEKETEKEQEAEHEKETEKEKEVERDIIRQETIPAPPVKQYETIAPLDGMAYSINHLFDKSFETIRAILPDEVALPGRDKIEFSPNFADQRYTLDDKRHATNHLTSRYLLALKDKDKTRYILVSHEDARRIKLGLEKDTLSGSREAVLCTLDGAVVSQSSPQAKDAFPKEEMRDLLLQAKFFTIKTNFSSREVNQLNTLIDNSVKPAAAELRASCQEYFEECLKYLKTQAEEYHNSYLESMLSK